MKSMTEPEVAWLAGIYEGEGTCGVSKGRAIRVGIVMTDFDVVERIFSLTGIGSLKEGRHQNPEHKPFLRWEVGSKDAVDFLSTVMPWLGQRRALRAEEAIQNWLDNRTQSGPNDTECIHGHSFAAPNRRVGDGSCHFCRLAASDRYRTKIKNQKASAAAKA